MHYTVFTISEISNSVPISDIILIKKTFNFHKFFRNIFNNPIIPNKYILIITKYAKCLIIAYILLPFWKICSFGLLKNYEFM
jgi:hypothetical protein